MDDEAPFDQDANPFPRRGRGPKPPRDRRPAFTTGESTWVPPSGRGPVPPRNLVRGFYDPMRFMQGPVEKLTLHDGPSGQAVLARLPLWMLATAFLVVIWHFAATGWSWLWPLVVLIGGYLAVVVPWRIIQWKSTHYILTNKRVMTVHGLWRRHAASVPLDKVSDVTFEQSFLERWMRFGTIRVLSAAEENYVRELAYVRDPEAVYSLLLRLIHEAADPVPPVPPGGAPGAPSPWGTPTPPPVVPAMSPRGLARIDPWDHTRPQDPVRTTREL